MILLLEFISTLGFIVSGGLYVTNHHFWFFVVGTISYILQQYREHLIEKQHARYFER